MNFFSSDLRQISGLLPCIRCISAHFCTAADLSERSAAIAAIQRHQPNHPPHKIVDSAALRERLASHFSGCIAQNAICIIE